MRLPVRGPRPDKTSISVGISKVSDIGPFWVAEQQAYFRQVGFASVQGVEIAGDKSMQRAIQSGQIDVGWMSMPSIVTAHDQGLNLKLFAGGSAAGPSHYASEAILVKGDSPIHLGRDLFAKTVGVTTLGSIGELQLRWWLGTQGIDSRTVKLAQLNAVGLAELPALIQGQVDAIQVSEPAVTTALRQNGARTLTDWSFLAPRPVFLAGWVATGKWLDSYPRTAHAFSNALAMAANWSTVNPSGANKLISENTGAPLALINAEATSVTLIPVAEPDIGPVLMASKTYGLTNKSFTSADFIWPQA